MEITVSAPAKINLMLDVTGKRSDGYHTLITIMQSISLADTVIISESESNSITVKTSNSTIPSDKNNIAYIAAEKFISYTKVKHNGLNIFIEKKISSEAGLGGGSADAAAVLVGLNNLFCTNLSLDELCRIGVTVGADVPFCIVGGTKICTGIGEIMVDTASLEQCYIVIAKGTSGICTKTAFEKIDSIGFESTLSADSYDGSINSLKNNGGNKFEAVSDNSNIQHIKEKMYSNGAEYSAMTGSGSAVFGLFLDKENADKCIYELVNSDIFAYLCTPISRGAAIT